MIRAVAFTAEGAALCIRLAGALPDCAGYAPERCCLPGLLPLRTPVGDWAAEGFREAQALLFIGAAGIAVRAIAPYVRDKGRDPAVLCVDETGRRVIPLLSGHIGGGAALARRIADLTGGEAVLTAATDVRGCFSPDAWAAENGCAVPVTGQVKAVSAALLDGEEVGLLSDFPVDSPLPRGVAARADTRCGILLSLRFRQAFPHTLWLAPRCLHLGIGCRRGVEAAAVEAQVLAALAACGLPIEGVAGAASIDLKAGEAGLLEFCRKFRLPLALYSAGELASVEGSRAASNFVREVAGVDNVCERAALAGGGGLLLEKTAGGGVTVAVAKREWRARFWEWIG